jgi:hypothetical protein
MGLTVTMQFGDGTNHDIEVTSDDPETAVGEARTYVKDNAWFEVTDPDTDEVLAKEHLW